jgi:hypothetical protein
MMQTTIYFREVKEPHIQQNEDSLRYWHIEAYQVDVVCRLQFPIGIAYVAEVPSVTAQLQFIFVADQWRKHGVAKSLVSAVKLRWPGVVPTFAMDERGTALLSSCGLLLDEEDEA